MKNDDDNKDLRKMFKKMKESEGEYPKKMQDETRKTFIRQILLNKYFWLIVFILVMIILVILASGYNVQF
jgi:sugar phosphate permease